MTLYEFRTKLRNKTLDNDEIRKVSVTTEKLLPLFLSEVV